MKTYQNPEFRRFSASQLACVTGDFDVFLERLKGPLKDPDTSVRFAAVEALGMQTHAPDEVIPVLVTAWEDTEDSVTSHAARFLADFGTNGLRAFGALSNAVENGRAGVANRALRTLVAMAPEKMLPMVLQILRSSEPRRRSLAAGELCEYPAATPEILAALQLARSDSDPQVVRTAINSRTQLREKSWDKGRTQVVIPGEPSYGGRQLGQWLKRRENGFELSEEATDALRQMGTNALPALLERLIYTDPVFNLDDYEVRLEAAGGLNVIGELAKPALPKLEELMNGEDPQSALFALVAASNMGTSSVGVLITALTNRNQDVRIEAVALLNDRPAQAFPEARKWAVPALIRLLDDPSETIRMNAANALKAIESGK